jgi:hypothetical protein
MNNSSSQFAELEPTSKSVQPIVSSQSVPTEENSQQAISLKAVLLIVQAVLIVVMGNVSVLSGDPLLNVVPSMIFQGISIIQKAANKSQNKLHSGNN